MRDKNNQNSGYIGPDYPGFGYSIPDNASGLVLLGGNLSIKNIITAYTKGLFPWHIDNGLVHWYSPKKRCVFLPEKLHIPRRITRTLKKTPIFVSINKHFDHVINCCAKPRKNQKSNQAWLTKPIIDAYIELNKNGWAHSVEIWKDDDVIGGLYGITIGRIFFAESMYSDKSNASKFAIYSLCKLTHIYDFPIIDCQVTSDHLKNMGAIEIPKNEFLTIVNRECSNMNKFSKWPKNLISLNKLLKL